MKRLRLISLCLVVMLFLSITGCGKEPDTDTKEKKEKDTLAEETKRPEFILYVDAQGNEHEMILEPGVEKHPYDWTKLKHKKGSDSIRYDDGTYTIRKGVDTSHHNGTIDWEKVKNAGYTFAFLRLGYRGYGKDGSLNVDKEFQSGFKAARKAGMKLGVYFFSQAVNEQEAIEEAELVLTELNHSKLDLPVVYDPELIDGDDARTDSVTGEQFTKNTIAFCEKIKKAGYKPAVYSNLFWESEIFTMAELNDYPIWYADYQEAPQTPYRFTFWQYSESGDVPGIAGGADLNVQFIRKKKKNK